MITNELWELINEEHIISGMATDFYFAAMDGARSDCGLCCGGICIALSGEMKIVVCSRACPNFIPTE